MTNQAVPPPRAASYYLLKQNTAEKTVIIRRPEMSIHQERKKIKVNFQMIYLEFVVDGHTFPKTTSLGKLVCNCLHGMQPTSNWLRI